MSAKNFHRSCACCALALAVLLTAGCSPFTALFFLFMLPPPKIDAQCTALEKQTVVVMSYASHGAQFQYPGIDNDLAKGVVRELRDNVKGIKLADPNEVRTWRDEHSDFELTDVGREFKATRVVYLEIESFTLFEQQSSLLYRGSAKVHVQVADMEKDGEIVWETFLEVLFPPSRPIPSQDMSQQKFRALFMQFVTRRLSHNFFSYRPEEDFEVN